MLRELGAARGRKSCEKPLWGAQYYINLPKKEGAVLRKVPVQRFVGGTTLKRSLPLYRRENERSLE